jgi:hypothetical protein
MSSLSLAAPPCGELPSSSSSSSTRVDSRQPDNDGGRWHGSGPSSDDAGL